MYKSRIWKWGLDKKLKGDEVLAVLLLKRDRDAGNRPSEYTIRGQPVDLDNINRYIKRNPSLMARFRAGQSPSLQTTLEVRCHTPPPLSSLPRVLAPSMEAYRAEEILGLFRNYIDGSFFNGAWYCDYDVSCVSRIPGDRSDELFERVISSFALVNRCLMRGDQVSISALLNPAFESLKEIIAAESPIFVVRTVCILWYLDRHHKNDLLRLVIDYLGGLIPIVLGPHHIMARIWRILGTTQFTDYYELSTCLYSMLVPLLEERIGPANYLTTIIYGDHVDCLFHGNRSSDSLTVASRYRAKVDATGRQHPWLVELAITQTAVLCANKEAEGRYGEAMECLQTLKRYNMTDEQRAVVSTQMGNYSYQMDDIPSAVSSYREAIRLAVSVGGDERLLLTCLSNLESALSKGGRPYEANRVLHYRLKRIADFATESSQLASKQPPGLPFFSVDIAAPTFESQVPSWLWHDEDFSGPVKAPPPVLVDDGSMRWLNVSCSPSDWTGSATDSHDTTRSSQYPSLSPLLGEWGDEPRGLTEWGSTVYQ